MKVGKAILAGKELHLVTGCHLEQAFDFLARLVGDRAVRVRSNFWEGVGFCVGCGELLGGDSTTIHGFPDELVADGGHFANLPELVRVVHVAEGTIAASVGMDAIGHLVVAQPKAVFLGNGRFDVGSLAGCDGRHFGEQGVSQFWSNGLVGLWSIVVSVDGLIFHR